MPEPISKAKLKTLRALADAKGRDEQGAFIAEGRRIVSDAIAAGAVPLAVVFEAEALNEHEELQTLAAKAGALAAIAEKKDFEALSDTVTSQGVLAAFKKPALSPRAAYAAKKGTFLILDNLRDPGNVGTVVRHAAAFDCAGIFLIKGCADPFNPKAVRASMGGIFSVPLETGIDAAAIARELAAAGVKLYACENARGAALPFDGSLAPKAAFIIGGETEGILPLWRECGAVSLRIPQSPRVESLNAAVAASILLCSRYGG